MLQLTRSTIGLAAILLLMGVTSVAASYEIGAWMNSSSQVLLAAEGNACRP